MKKLSFLTLILTFAIIGCGKVRDTRLGTSVKDITGIGALEEPPQKNFTASELTIAARVCSSLKSKRLALIAAPGTVAYYFQLERKDCKNKTIESSKVLANIVAVGTELEYSSATSINYFTDVITDQSPALLEICNATLATSTEAKKISNTIALGNKLFTVAFSTAENTYDTVEVFTRVRNAQSAYVLDNAESIAVATNAAQLGEKYIGVEKERSHYVACNGREFTTMKENWLSAVTIIP